MLWLCDYRYGTLIEGTNDNELDKGYSARIIVAKTLLSAREEVTVWWDGVYLAYMFTIRE